MPWTVKYFRTAKGKYPVKEFMEEQNLELKAKISKLISLLVEGGPFLKPPYCKKLQSNLYELRVTGKVAVRVFYSSKTQEYYLLHAFKKKTQKTPKKEMEIAIDRMNQLI